MGNISGVCSYCAEKPERTAPTAVVPSKNKGPEDRGRKGSKRLAAHEGQKRALLCVKEGGFSLKNFAATNPGKLEDFYNVSKTVVGEGAFGKVVIAKDKSTGVAKAVKAIQKVATKEVQKMQEEINIISVLDHPNIVRLYESFQDRRTIYLVMELCDGGELFERIVDAGSFSEAEAAQCVKQMLLAINYLHQNLIIHRDLKPENWLVATKGPVEKSTLKLIDFGISKRLKPGDVATSKAGTPNYVAPEVLAGRYNEKVDIWSTGVIMYIMLSGLQPFTGKNADEILASVKRAKFNLEGGAWKSISPNAKGLIKALLQKTVSVRPAASQALQHGWFTAFSDGKEDGGFLSKIEIENLKKFADFNKVKKAALTVVASQLSDQRIDYLKNVFLSIDKNSDGTLSVAELKQGLKSVGIKIPKDLAKVLEQVDTDGSGVLDYTEFLAATIDEKVYSQESVVWAAFRKFDVDGSGSIDKSELMNVLGDDALKSELCIAGDRSQLAKIFDEIDINGDGVIDFDEFFGMLRDAEDVARDEVAERQILAGEEKPSSSRSRPSTHSAAAKAATPKEKRSPKTSPRRPSRSPRVGGSPRPQGPNIGIGLVSDSAS